MAYSPDMKTQNLFLPPLTVCALWLVPSSVPARLMGRHDQQERYNQGLIAAIRKHDYEAVESWLQRGADPNCAVPMPVGSSAGSQESSTPLVEALLGNEGESDNPPDYPTITRSLLQHGASVSRMGWGWTPVQAAASKGKAASLEMLLQRGANVNAGKGTEWPAFFYACVTPAMTREMLAYGADVNMTDNAGKTALMWAYRRDYPSSLEMARVLLDHGADPARKDKAGDSPLALARKSRVDPTRDAWYALLRRYAAKQNIKRQ